MEHSYKDFTIGVEIEFTGVTRETAAKLVEEYFGTTKVHLGGSYDTYRIFDTKGRPWKIVRDSSIIPQNNQNGEIDGEFQCELVSPILKYEDIKTLQRLYRHLRYRGGIHINASTGFHVHVGAEKLNANNLRNLCNMIYSKQYLLEKALLYTPRKEYCNNFSKGFIEELNQKKPKDFEEFAEVWYGMPNVWKSVTNRYHDSKYKIINLHPLLSGRMETVEFRLFNGVLDEKELKAYIQFCTLIMAQTLKQKKVFYKPCIPFNEKYTFRIWLLKMGAIGDEFKDMRSILLRNLEGNIAWKYAPNFLKEEVYINQVHSNNDSYSNVDETDEYIDIF